MKTKLLFTLTIVSFMSLKLLATQHTVTTFNDSKDNPSPGMLRYIIQNASSGDTIIFATNAINLDTTLIISNKSLLINGGYGVTIDGRNNGGVLNISCTNNDTVILRNLKFKDGLVESSFASGGGIYAFISSGDLIVENCSFLNNTVIASSEGQGGALRTNGGIFNNCYFINNGVTGTGSILGGGAIYAVGGRFNNCVIAGNAAGYGGGMYASGSVVNNCTITQNNTSISNGGGGVSSENSSSFANCIIYNNLSNGVVNNIDDVGSTFTNSAVESGNTIVGSNNNVGISTSPFTHNGTDSLSLIEGSACIDAGTLSGIQTLDVDIVRAKRVYNSKIDIGAYEYDPRSPLLVTRSDDDYYFPARGMLRYAIKEAIDGDTILFAIDSIGFTLDHRISGQAKSFALNGDKSLVIDGKDVGKALINAESNLIFYIYFQNQSKTIKIKNLIFQNGYGYSAGGIVSNATTNDTLYIENCVFRNNVGKVAGGINVHSSKIINCEFINNNSTGTGISNKVGGMYAENSEVVNCIYRGNFVNSENASYATGAAAFRNSVVTNCVFTGNYCLPSGDIRYDATGGVRSLNSIVKNCSFYGNFASGSESAGGLSSWDNLSETYNCLFEGNYVTVEDYEAGGGGALNANGTFTNCKFINNRNIKAEECENYSNWNGAGVLAQGGKFINCLFAENIGGYGTGLNLRAYFDTDIINCTFTKNSSYPNENTSGGLYISYNTNYRIDIRNCILFNNYPLNIFGDSDIYTLNYCALKEAHDGTGNIQLNQSPFQSSLAEDYFFLKENSECINKGDTVGIGHLLPISDIVENPRISENIIDLGVIEYSGRIKPEVTWPTTNGITYGDSIHLAINADGSANINGQFVVDSSIFPDAGLNMVEIVFSPEYDSILNYESITDYIQVEIHKAEILATVANDTVNYGDIHPNTTIAYSGFKLDDNINMIEKVPVSVIQSYDNYDAGNYPGVIEAKDGEDKNYFFKSENGNLLIQQTKLIATANDTSVVLGSVEPMVSIKYNGFVKGENYEVLDIVPSTSINNYQDLEVGLYTGHIEVFGGEDNNYYFEYVPGDLTISSILSVRDDQLKKYQVYPTIIDTEPITILNFKDAQLRLVSIAGELIKIENINSDIYKLNISDQKNGLYILQILNQEGFNTFKIIKNSFYY